MIFCCLSFRFSKTELMQTKGYILVEGHGEVGAVKNLVERVATQPTAYLPWATPLRWLNLHQWVPSQ